MNKEPRSLHFMLRLFAVIVVMHLSSGMMAQNANQSLESYLQQVRAGRAPVAGKELVKTLGSMTGLASLEANRKDSVAAVRASINIIEQQIAYTTADNAVRQEAIFRLVLACKDKDGGNVGQALQYLTTFRQQDFTTAARDSVRSLFRQRITHFDDVVKLTGFLQLTAVKEELRAYTTSGNIKTLRWAALLSLARMNDAAAVKEVMSRAGKVAVNDDAVYRLFPDLVYTRHPQAVAYMVNALNSDEKNCLTADAERETPIPCGYRIMEQLAPLIDKYPVKLDESGDLVTKDYVATLQTVREWFARNKDYKIISDRY